MALALRNRVSSSNSSLTHFTDGRMWQSKDLSQPRTGPPSPGMGPLLPARFQAAFPDGAGETCQILTSTFRHSFTQRLFINARWGH